MRTNIQIIQLKDPERIYHLCENTTDQEQTIAELRNAMEDRWVTVTVMHRGYILRQFRIPPRGRRYCRFCNGEFVSLFPIVSCTDDTATVRDGLVAYEMDPRGNTYYYKEDDSYPVLKNDLMTLERDGTITYRGISFGSATGNPIVFCRDNVYIDSMGTVVYQKPERFAPPYYLQYIHAVSNGYFCITSARHVLYSQQEFCLNEPILDLCSFHCTNLVLSAYGNVYEECDSPDWDPYDDDCDPSTRTIWARVHVGQKVHALSAGGHTVAMAAGSNVYLYQYDDTYNRLSLVKKIVGKEYISDLAVSDQKLVLMYLSGNWEVLNWQEDTLWHSKANYDMDWLWGTFAKDNSIFR